MHGLQDTISNKLETFTATQRLVKGIANAQIMHMPDVHGII